MKKLIPTFQIYCFKNVFGKLVNSLLERDVCEVGGGADCQVEVDGFQEHAEAGDGFPWRPHEQHRRPDNQVGNRRLQGPGDHRGEVGIDISERFRARWVWKIEHIFSSMFAIIKHAR